MRPAHRGNRIRVTRRGKPIVHCCADFATLYGWLARAMMASDQQQHTLAAGDCLLKAPVDCRPGSIEIHAVKVEHAIGVCAPPGKSAIPAAVEGLVGKRHGFRLDRNLTDRVGSRSRRNYPRFFWRRGVDCIRLFGISRQRADRRRYPRPELRFLRAEGAHGPRHPSAPGLAPGRSRTCRRQSPLRRPPIPRTYRSGWVP